MAEKTVEIQVLDRPNGNGRTYTRGVVLSAIPNRPVYGKIGMPEYGEWLPRPGVPVLGSMDAAKISHEVVDLRIEGDQLVGTVRTLDNPDGRRVAENIDVYDFRLAGYANVSDDGVISNLVIHSINAVLDGA